MGKNTLIDRERKKATTMLINAIMYNYDSWEYEQTKQYFWNVGLLSIYGKPTTANII